MAKLQAAVQFFSDGSDDEVDKEDHAPRPTRGEEEEEDNPASDKGRENKSEEKKKGGKGKAKKKNNKLHNCIKLAREKSYGRVFDDPFSAAVVLLVLPFCPPLSVYLTFRECGGLNRHRAREVGIAVLLTILGWVPGVVCEFLPISRVGKMEGRGRGTWESEISWCDRMLTDRQMLWWCTSGISLDRRTLRRTRRCICPLGRGAGSVTIS